MGELKASVRLAQVDIEAVRQKVSARSQRLNIFDDVRQAVMIQVSYCKKPEIREEKLRGLEGAITVTKKFIDSVT